MLSIPLNHCLGTHECAQFNCVKEMTLPEVAEAFQSLGYNVLLYDARSVGGSGGQPRNLIDPLLMAEDLSGEHCRIRAATLRGCSELTIAPIDIYTYVTTLQSVDSHSIILWGISFGAVLSACCAAIDRRPKALVMVCPLFSYVQPHKAEKAYAQLIKDRVSQLRGNESYSLAPFTSKGDNLIGMGGAGGPGGVEAYNLMKAAAELGHPDFRDRISLQTYHKLAMFRPKEYMEMVRSPTMMVVPELDNISPPEEQREAFACIKSPKREYWAKGKGHLEVVTCDGSKELVAATVEFLREALEGEMV